MARIPRMMIAGEQAVYHVMSRTALDGFPFGDAEKEFLVSLINRKWGQANNVRQCNSHVISIFAWLFLTENKKGVYYGQDTPDGNCRRAGGLPCNVQDRSGWLPFWGC